VTQYILRRLLIMIPTLLGVTVVVFAVMALSPGGLKASNLITGQMSPEAKRALETYYNQRYGLDAPLHEQYLRWLNNLSPIGFVEDAQSGERQFTLWKPINLGESLYYGRPVADLLMARVPITVLLNVLSLPVIYALAIVMGVYAAKHSGGRFDRYSGGVMLGLWSMPTMLAGILLIGFFASDQYWHWFPVSGLSYRVALDMPFLPHWQSGTTALLFAACIIVSWSVAWGAMRLVRMSHRQLAALVVGGVCTLLAAVSHGVAGEMWAVMVVTAGLFGLARLPQRIWRTVLCGLLLSLVTMLVFRDGLFEGFVRGFLLDRLWHLVLPVLCLSYGGLAYLAKLTRSSVLENLGADFTRTAQAKGLSEHDILWRHVFRNSLLPLITVSASLVPGLLAGSIIVETLFSIEGMGKLAVEAVRGKDKELVLSVTLISGVLTLVSYLLADICYAIADPRVSYD